MSRISIQEARTRGPASSVVEKPHSPARRDTGALSSL